MALERRGWPDDELDPPVREVPPVQPGREVVQQWRPLRAVEQVHPEELGPVEPLSIESMTRPVLDYQLSLVESRARDVAMERVPQDTRQIVQSVETLLGVGCAFDLAEIGLPPGVVKVYEQYVQDVEADAAQRRAQLESDEFRILLALDRIMHELGEQDLGETRMASPTSYAQMWRQLQPYILALDLPSDRGSDFREQISAWWERFNADQGARAEVLGHMKYIDQHPEIIDPNLPLPTFKAGDTVRVPRSDGSVSEDWQVAAMGNDGLVHVTGPVRPDGKTPARKFRQEQLGLWNKRPANVIDGVAAQEVPQLPLAPEAGPVEQSLSQPEQQPVRELAEGQVVAVVRSDGRLEHDWTIIGQEDGRWVVRNARGDVKKPTTESLQQWQQLWADSLDHKVDGVL